MAAERTHELAAYDPADTVKRRCDDIELEHDDTGVLGHREVWRRAVKN
jgi:hypothetical protein